MGAESERHVLVGESIEHDLVGALEHVLVAIARCPDEQEAFALAHRASTDLDIARCSAGQRELWDLTLHLALRREQARAERSEDRGEGGHLGSPHDLQRWHCDDVADSVHGGEPGGPVDRRRARRTLEWPQAR
jgi:hypothetical protein